MDSQHNQKHAYLVMAHNNFDQLQILIELLDDPRNDIYLHIDKKASGFLPENINTKHAELYLVDPIRVTWGGHSQIACEMKLFKSAAPKHYLYYHVLSGVDLPIKIQDEIHAFFQEHSGQNFIGFDENAMATGNFFYRTQYYHFFQNITGRSTNPLMHALQILERISLRTQKALHMKRKDLVPLYKGANWVSITDELVQYILSCEELIKKQFYYSVCADEVFLQSVAMSSPYRDTIVDNYYRQIDWTRGSPYTYRKEDVPQILASPAFFARKFDSSVDSEAISLIVKHLENSTNVHE